MEATPAFRVAAGQFVIAELDGKQTVCLKAERTGKDHVNHFLVPLDPVTEPRELRLHYLDPEQELRPAEGFSFNVDAAPKQAAAEVGDVLSRDGALWLKVLDDPAAQRLYCYVGLACGQIRPRMERQQYITLGWHLERI